MWPSTRPDPNRPGTGYSGPSQRSLGTRSTMHQQQSTPVTITQASYSHKSYSHKNFIYVARFLSMKCIQEIKQTERLLPSLFIRIMYINNQKYQILVLENLYLSEFHFNAYTYKYTYFNDIKMNMYLIF